MTIQLSFDCSVARNTSYTKRVSGAGIDFIDGSAHFFNYDGSINNVVPLFKVFSIKGAESIRHKTETGSCTTKFRKPSYIHFFDNGQKIRVNGKTYKTSNVDFIS